MRKNNCITTPKILGDNKQSTRDFVTFIILGENHGYRMKSYGPLSLIKVGEKTLLQKQIDSSFLDKTGRVKKEDRDRLYETKLVIYTE